MKSFVRLTRLAALLCLCGSLSQVDAAAPPKPTSGAVVIVFKDGHRQTFNLSDVDRIEFAGGASSISADANNLRIPSRDRFIGQWECGDGQGNTFYITLNEDGTAHRTIGDVNGHWDYVDGEARVTWNDDRQDAIRKSGSQFFKFAYGSGKSFTDEPDNVARARKDSGPA